MKEFSGTDVAKRFKHKDKKNLLAYLSAMYSKKSPLNKVTDLAERKKIACTKSGLNPDDPEVQEIMDLKHEGFNELLFHFLGVFQDSNRFNKLCSDQQLYWRMLEMVRKPLPDDLDEEDEIKRMKLRSSLSEEASALASRIEHAYSDIFGTDDVIQNAEMKVRKFITPEARLKNIA